MFASSEKRTVTSRVALGNGVRAAAIGVGVLVVDSVVRYVDIMI